MLPSGWFLVIEMNKIEKFRKDLCLLTFLSQNQINVRPCLWTSRQTAADHRWSTNHRLRTADIEAFLTHITLWCFLRLPALSLFYWSL